MDENLAYSITQPIIKLEGHDGKSVCVYGLYVPESGSPKRIEFKGKLTHVTNTYIKLDWLEMRYIGDDRAIEEIHDQDGNVVYWNPAFREFMEKHGLSEEGTKKMKDRFFREYEGCL